MYQTTKGLVLKETIYNDADKLLDVLTADQGLITVKARGARRSKSTLKSACQVLCYAEFTLTESHGKTVVTEAAPIEQFRALRDDLERFYLGCYFAQVSRLLSQQDAPDEALLALLLHSLNALCRPDRAQLTVKAAFELRAACLAGFQPELSGCAVCGSSEPALFDVMRGMLFCGGCRPDGTGLCMPVGPGVLAAMRYLVSCPVNRLFSFTLNEASLQQLSDVTETYLSTQLEQSFSTLRLYKSLFLPMEYQNNDGAL